MLEYISSVFEQFAAWKVWTHLSGFHLLYISLGLWIFGVLVAINRYRKGSFEARVIAGSILINLTFSGLIIFVWVAVFGGGAALSEESAIAGSRLMRWLSSI
jgi:hypothetical protein